MAPEMILGEYYDTQVDIWSLGVLLYSIVSGHMPFPATNQSELFSKIAAGKFNFEHKEFLMVSNECKDLIKKMLVRDVKTRLTATQVLQHDWFRKFAHNQSMDESVDKLDSQAFKRMMSYKSTSYFERTALNLLVKLCSEDELHDLTEKFKEIDLDGTGLIHPHEIKKYIIDNKK